MFWLLEGGRETIGEADVRLSPENHLLKPIYKTETILYGSSNVNKTY